jgi:thiosulfate/3-mercaptopyruvate sulfurtransferase
VFEAAMRRLGVRADRPVVAYDQADATSAARAWWLLGWFGHPAPLVLDGGLAAWVAAGLPLATGPDDEGVAGDFTARPGGRAMVDADGAARLAREGVLLDSRAAPRYRGEVEPIDPVAGHIPGAVNAPAAGNVDPAGRLLPPAALRARFEAAGARPGEPVGAYCGSGVVAAQQVLALEVAGLDAVLYPGSWSEWITDPGRPVATGGAPG